MNWPEGVQDDGILSQGTDLIHSGVRSDPVKRAYPYQGFPLHCKVCSTAMLPYSSTSAVVCGFFDLRLWANDASYQAFGTSCHERPWQDAATV